MSNESNRPDYHTRHNCIVAKINSPPTREPSRSRNETAQTLNTGYATSSPNNLRQSTNLQKESRTLHRRVEIHTSLQAFSSSYAMRPAVPSKRRSWTSYASAFFGGFRSPQPKTTTSVGLIDGLDKKELQVRPVLRLSASWQTLTCQLGTPWTAP
jgi:hypothetical protein